MPSAPFDFTLQVIAPVLLILMLGYVLLKRRFISEGFVDSGSKLVFNIALPALLFITISKADFSLAANPTILVVGIIGTLLFVAFLMVITHFTVQQPNAKGVVIQGGFRANMGIIGLAYCSNAYGPEGLAVASVYLGCITVLFNLLSVFVLNYYSGGAVSLLSSVKNLITNPLILAIVLALPFSYFAVPLPSLAVKTGGYVAQLTLPLALLCTGASLQFRSFTGDLYNISLSTISKCLLYPLVIVAGCALLGVREMELGVVLLMSVAPTAAASYVMARNLGGDYRLAASIIATTTLVSLPVTAIAFSLLQNTRLL
ncbi:AEC family transporter [Alteromonas aestuariivivens]|uniref:AEC family transporter n=1 Tax=Alteromonas aestuariivivens TaxID=1938339 RepID=A0A3D8MBX2_9ALTE|nr:AEC family transporter [Alteromonas aestuariivivens]RDV28014.1 AEC family transporter [Alteromonas aestuariivivens]